MKVCSLLSFIIIAITLIAWHPQSYAQKRKDAIQVDSFNTAGQLTKAPVTSIFADPDDGGEIAGDPDDGGEIIKVHLPDASFLADLSRDAQLITENKKLNKEQKNSQFIKVLQRAVDAQFWDIRQWSGFVTDMAKTSDSGCKSNFEKSLSYCSTMDASNKKACESNCVRQLLSCTGKNAQIFGLNIPAGVRIFK